MIKSLLEPDEKQPEEIKTEREEKSADDLELEESFETLFAGIELPPSSLENLSEISEPADDELIVSEKPPETMPAEKIDEEFNFSEPHYNQPEKLFAETINQEQSADNVNEPIDDESLAGFPIDEINFDWHGEAKIENPDFELPAATSNETTNPEPRAETINESAIYESPVEPETPRFENSGVVFQTLAEPESFAETARRSGLAYAAAITLFGAIVFMLIIGWFADLLFGSSPWGIVGGIILGATIGFFQFFRLTAQIFKDRN